MSDSWGRSWTLASSPGLWILLCALFRLSDNCIISVKMSSLNRTQEDNVLFHPDAKIGNETLWIKWYFLTKNLHLLTICSEKKSLFWIIPQKEYIGRLSSPDGKSLKITYLTSEDSGCYEAHIISVSGKIHIQKFGLTVFGTGTRESNMNSNWLFLYILVPVLTIL